jgi:hypothetical protein
LRFSARHPLMPRGLKPRREALVCARQKPEIRSQKSERERRTRIFQRNHNEQDATSGFWFPASGFCWLLRASRQRRRMSSRSAATDTIPPPRGEVRRRSCDAGVGGNGVTPPGALKRARHPPRQGEGWSKGYRHDFPTSPGGEVCRAERMRAGPSRQQSCMAFARFGRQQECAALRRWNCTLFGPHAHEMGRGRACQAALRG